MGLDVRSVFSSNLGRPSSSGGAALALPSVYVKSMLRGRLLDPRDILEHLATEYRKKRKHAYRRMREGHAGVDAASCHVVAYCGKAYAGPEPLQGEVMRSCALSREAADALPLRPGRRVVSGAMDRGDRVCVVSRDASWHNAAVPRVHERDHVHGGQGHARTSAPRGLAVVPRGDGPPEEREALLNFVRNNVAPDRREEFYSRMTTAK
eukprot:jgi/Mesvir1/8571/Mv02300-RA.1